MKTLNKTAAAKRYYKSHIGRTARICLFVLGLITATSNSFAQAASTPQTQGAPLTITLQDALQRARQNDPQYHDSITQLGLAHEDRVQARAGLLPDVNFNNSFIYTQGTGPLPSSCQTAALGCPTSRFVANNGVHEYISQGNVHQEFSLITFGEYRKAAAAEAVAWAKAEIATRGLVVTVVKAYFGLVAAQRKYGTEQLAAEEAPKTCGFFRKFQSRNEFAISDSRIVWREWNGSTIACKICST